MPEHIINIYDEDVAEAYEKARENVEAELGTDEDLTEQEVLEFILDNSEVLDEDAKLTPEEDKNIESIVDERGVVETASHVLRCTNSSTANTVRKVANHVNISESDLAISLIEDSESGLDEKEVATLIKEFDIDKNNLLNEHLIIEEEDIQGVLKEKFDEEGVGSIVAIVTDSLNVDIPDRQALEYLINTQDVDEEELATDILPDVETSQVDPRSAIQEFAEENNVRDVLSVATDEGSQVTLLTNQDCMEDVKDMLDVDDKADADEVINEVRSTIGECGTIAIDDSSVLETYQNARDMVSSSTTVGETTDDIDDEEVINELSYAYAGWKAE